MTPPPNTMAEVRQRVDQLDDAIVPLLVARSQCMQHAARIKQQASQVRDEARIETIVARVRALASQQGGNADLMERLYRQMMECFIAYEADLFAAKQPNPTTGTEAQP
jgi:isochorismate pyruvate lyase